MLKTIDFIVAHHGMIPWTLYNNNKDILQWYITWLWNILYGVAKTVPIGHKPNYGVSIVYKIE